MNSSTHIKRGDRSFTEELMLVFISIVLPFVCILLYLYLPEANNVSFSDNDDFMRYHQFTHWLRSGNWYLTPIEQFNPQSGVLMHWSRLVDIPLAGATLFLSPFFGLELASLYATGIVPVIYLLLTLLALAKITYKLFGNRFIVLTCVYFIGSIAISKFKPGAIDHHNLQMLIFAWSIAIIPINSKRIGTWQQSFLYALLLSLSLWVGLENLIVFSATLFFIVYVGYQYNKQYLVYFTRICGVALVISTCFTLLNRPISEFTTFYIDMLSWPYLLCLGIGFVYGCISQLYVDKYGSYAFIVFTIIAILLVLLIVPELLMGVYYNYPELLKVTWLNHVTEARSILSYVFTDGLMSNHLHFLYLFPALISIFYVRDNKVALIAYLLFLLVFLFAVLWQVRTIFNVYILAVPFQAYMVAHWCSHIRFSLAKLIVIFTLAPVILSILILKAVQSVEDKKQSTMLFDKSSVSAILKSNNVEKSKILAPIDFGASVIALTDNSVISAPYHRNIDGNIEMIHLFSSKANEHLKRELKRKEFDYVLIGKDRSTRILLNVGEEDSLVNLLFYDNGPSWLVLKSEDELGNKLFEINYNESK
ncbi:hypothetical protein [Vibrio atypicus]|uniref:hypothetical protein n=1 Tax=Vibrio atypicus TaxID=558271 RepID=UPI0013594F4D|nr:hypothetical protein [Vibrio atypicus]